MQLYDQYWLAPSQLHAIALPPLITVAAVLSEVLSVIV